MGELVGLMRSFGPAMANVFERWEEARDYVGLVDDSEERRLRSCSRRRVKKRLPVLLLR